jgi:hypothetical protein
MNQLSAKGHYTNNKYQRIISVKDSLISFIRLEHQTTVFFLYQLFEPTSYYAFVCASNYTRVGLYRIVTSNVNQ